MEIAWWSVVHGGWVECSEPFIGSMYDSACRRIPLTLLCAEGYMKAFDGGRGFRP